MKVYLYVAIVIGLALLLGWNGLLVKEKAALEKKYEAEQALTKTATDNETAAKTSAANWEALAKKAVQDLDNYKKEQAALTEANKKALAIAQVAQAQATNELRSYMAKYKTAIKNPSCAAILATPVCQELR